MIQKYWEAKAETIEEAERNAICTNAFEMAEKNKQGQNNTYTRYSSERKQKTEPMDEMIIRVMLPGRRYTVQDIYEAIKDADSKLTPAQVSRLLTQLKNDGIIKREIVDERAYFSIT